MKRIGVVKPGPNLIMYADILQIKSYSSDGIIYSETLMDVIVSQSC